MMKVFAVRNWSFKQVLTSVSRCKYICYQCAAKRKFSSDDSFSANIPLVQKFLANLKKEYETLKTHVEKTGENVKSRRICELQPVIEILNQRTEYFKTLEQLKEISPEESKDTEYLALVEEERKNFESKIEELDVELKEVLMPVDRLDYCNDVVMEITAGVGGQEAMLFAREMLDMYCGFCEYKGWTAEIAQLDTTEIGGLRHASMFVSGNRAYQHLKHEGGVHRVQRIPTTEKAGRVHTSTVSVAVLPQPEEVDVVLKDKDLRIETKRASGAGGQHVNTTDSAVRILHIPTGISVESQVDRSQIKNRALAMQRLRAKIYEQEMAQQIADVQANRKQQDLSQAEMRTMNVTMCQVGSSYRSEKIRTYNFNQDRITDHRVPGNMHSLRSFLTGNHQLETLLDKLWELERRERLMNMVASAGTSS